MKEQWSRTDTIKFHIPPTAPNKNGITLKLPPLIVKSLTVQIAKWPNTLPLIGGLKLTNNIVAVNLYKNYIEVNSQIIRLGTPFCVESKKNNHFLCLHVIFHSLLITVHFQTNRDC